MTEGADAPTEAFYAATRPLERLPAADDAPWTCGRCKGRVEPLSQGHYGSTCLVLAREAGHHFCCPLPAGCELQAS